MAVIDTGASVSCVSEQLFADLLKEFKHLPVLPVPQTCIVGATGKKSSMINKQVLLNLRKGGFTTDWDFLVVKSLLKPIIIGMDFVTRHVTTVDFEKHAVGMKDKNGSLFTLDLALGSSLEGKSNVNLYIPGERDGAEVLSVGEKQIKEDGAHPSREEFLEVVGALDNLTGKQKEELLKVLVQKDGRIDKEVDNGGHIAEQGRYGAGCIQENVRLEEEGKIAAIGRYGANDQARRRTGWEEV